MNLSYPDRMVIVITGISSFIGAHLAIQFAKAGNTVIGTYAAASELEEEIRNLRVKAARLAGVQDDILDISDEVSSLAFINRYNPDFWIHHAGWAVAYGNREYDLFMANRINVLPLNHIYSQLSNVDCKGILITGTSAEYSDNENACYESDLCLPSMPYGLSKLSETIRARQLALEFEIPTRVGRVFIPFGHYDVPNKLVPSVVSSLCNSRSIDLSSCKQKRDFININDLVMGYSAMLQDLKRSSLFEIFNLCSGEGIVVKDFLLKIAEIIEADPQLLRFGEKKMRPGGPPVSYGSREKAEEILGWKPTSIEIGLKSYLRSDQPSIPI